MHRPRAESQSALDQAQTGSRGSAKVAHCLVTTDILWRLHSGAPWRDIPERYGPWQRIYGRFRRWRRDGTWAKILTHLLDDLERRGCLGHELWLVDATVIRASRAAGGAEKKSGRGAAAWRTETGATRRAS